MYICVVLYVFIIELNSLKIQDHTVIIYPVFPYIGVRNVLPLFFPVDG